MEETSDNLETSNRSIPEENSCSEHVQDNTSTMGNMQSCDIDEQRNVRNKVQLKKREFYSWFLKILVLSYALVKS